MTINMTGVPAARSFYAGALGALGLRESVDPFGRFEYGREGHVEFGFYGPPSAFFEHGHVAFVAPSRDAVDSFFGAALTHGGISLGPPTERPEFGFYSAYVLDPEGHGVEAGVSLLEQ